MCVVLPFAVWCVFFFCYCCCWVFLFCFVFLSCPGSMIFVFPFTTENKCRKNNSWYDFGDALKCFCLQNIHRDTWGLAEYSCHASSCLWKIAKDIWLKLASCIYFAVCQRQVWRLLEHFNVLFSTLQVNTRWLSTNFKREGGSKNSQKASCVLLFYARYYLKSTPNHFTQETDLLCHKEYS